MSEPEERLLRTAPTRKLADEWALVLVAEGLSPTVRRVAGAYEVWVDESEFRLAEDSLRSYARENRDRLERRLEPLAPSPWRIVLAVQLGLAVLHAKSGPRDGGSVWFRQGSADAWSIMHGEWWRSFTATTLHADESHLLGNIIAGMIFVTEACRTLGAGLGLMLVMLSGAAGHALTAVYYGRHHDSVGASTAVFGALGLLVGLAAMRRETSGVHWRGPMVPIAAGLGVVAMLGTGPQSDIWGHVFGFLSGTALGGAAALRDTIRPGRAMQAVLGGFAMMPMLVAWWLALR